MEDLKLFIQIVSTLILNQNNFSNLHMIDEVIFQQGFHLSHKGNPYACNNCLLIIDFSEHLSL